MMMSDNVRKACETVMEQLKFAADTNRRWLNEGGDVVINPQYRIPDEWMGELEDGMMSLVDQTVKLKYVKTQSGGWAISMRIEAD